MQKFDHVEKTIIIKEERTTLIKGSLSSMCI